MKFTITKNKLLNALNTVSRAVSNKNPNAILTGIKFELTDSLLSICGSNAEITIVANVPCIEKDETNIVVFQTGAVVLSGKYILEIIRKLDGDVVEFNLVESSLMKVYDNLSDFSLNTMRLDDYPPYDFIEVGSIVRLPSTTLSTIIDQTAFSASDKEARPILTGVNIKGENRRLECVATDSYRLARKIVNLEADVDFNVTVPAKNFIEVGKILEGDHDVEICVSQKRIIFSIENLKISLRLISGIYPDTSKIVPTTFLYTLRTSAVSVINAIDRASLLSIDRTNHVKMTVNQENCLISSRSVEVGSVIEKVMNYQYDGEHMSISFTAKYVIEAIRALKSDNIIFSLNGDSKSFVITNKDDDSIVQLLQPVRTY